jgi:hypothetical protein
MGEGLKRAFKAARDSRTQKITEKHLQELVRKAAIVTGWKYYHTWNSMHSVKGFPDCVLVKGPRLLFVELKNEAGMLTKEQQEWLTVLNNTGAECHLVRPSYFDQFFEEVLKK